MAKVCFGETLLGKQREKKLHSEIRQTFDNGETAEKFENDN